jgi:hypothetical protein
LIEITGNGVLVCNGTAQMPIRLSSAYRNTTWCVEYFAVAIESFDFGVLGSCFVLFWLPDL